MILFRTEFPISSTSSEALVRAAVHKSLAGSPHYHLELLPPLEISEGHILEAEQGGNRILTGAVSRPGRSITGYRHIWCDPKRGDWCTDVVFVQEDGLSVVSVSVACDIHQLGNAPPTPKPPYVIGLMLRELGGGNDGDLTVQAKPFYLRVDDEAIAERIIQGQSKNALPVIYVSADFEGHPHIDVVELAKRLGGLAHVVVEPSRSFSLRLAKRVSEQNPYGGAVEILWPGGLGLSSRLIPRSFASAAALSGEAERRIRSGWLFAKSPRDCTWLDLQEAISTLHVEELRRSGSSVDEWVEAFDVKEKQFTEKLARSSARVAQLERELGEVRRRLESRQPTLLAPGNGQEFYEGEYQDVVIRTLREDLPNLSQGSRRFHLLEEILQSNQASDSPADFERSLRDSIGTAMKISERELAKMDDLGFDVTNDGKHYKALFRGDPRYTFTLYKTASDHHSPSNAVAQICRKLFGR